MTITQMKNLINNDAGKKVVVAISKTHVAVCQDDLVKFHEIDKKHFWSRNGYIGPIVMTMTQKDTSAESFFKMVTHMIKGL